MKKYFSLLPMLGLAGLATLAPWAQAQQAGDNVVAFGWLRLAPQDASENLKIAGQTVPQTGAAVGKADTPGLQFNHYFSDHVSVAIDGGLPPRFKVTGTGVLQGTNIGSTKQWSPAAVFKYHFGESSTALRPYVGAGLTYVWFSDVKLDSAFTKELSSIISQGQSDALPSQASLSKSLAPVANLGATYQLNHAWSIGLSLSYVWLDAKADLSTSTPAGSVHSTTKITLNPIVSFLSLGYKF